MAKQGGLGTNGYVGGYDLSGDILSIGTIKGGPAALDLTPINALAHYRVGGLIDGEISFVSAFNPTTAQAHPVLSALPTTDVGVMVAIPATPSALVIGDCAACILAKQINYDPTRDAAGGLTFAVQSLANRYGTEWGVLLTAGKRTDTSATAGTGLDFGTYGSAVTITGASAANPTTVTATAHGLVTGDSIVISGSDKSALNAAFTVTVVNANTFTVPVDLTGGAATGGTFLKTNTNYGLQAYLQMFLVTGTSCTAKLQSSNDDAATDAYADVTGGAFAAVNAGSVSAQRIQTSTTLQIERWLRATTTGTFNPATFAVAVIRNLSTPPS